MSDDPLDDIKDISELFTPEVMERQRKIEDKLAIMRRNIDKMRRAGLDVTQFDEPVKALETQLDQLKRLSRM